ncbi:MAG TPA: GDP-mannose 4,6-dehydratase [Acidimicrobiales bacterium]|nr:GDP-mannose 4,6-dehydratase [Acidimicrobiales bacterium]
MADLVAVTGADGFIGSHLVEALVTAGYRVRAMAFYNSMGTWGWLEDLEPDVWGSVEVHPGDIRDRDSVLSLMREATVVYHLAALTAVPYSYRAPTSYIGTNVAGTLNVLESARVLGTPRIVHTSTSAVYGTARTVPIDECHPLQAQSPYAASKIAADKLAESYHLSYELPVVVLRPFNTYGPRQSARSVIPAVVSQAAAGVKDIKVGSLSPVRDFTYVADTANALLRAGTAPCEQVVGEVLNAGSGRGISVADLVWLVGEVMAVKLQAVVDPQRLRPLRSEVMQLVCDSTRLEKLTGWQPEHSLEEGLGSTAAWFSNPENLGRYKTNVYNI